MRTRRRRCRYGKLKKRVKTKSGRRGSCKKKSKRRLHKIQPYFKEYMKRMISEYAEEELEEQSRIQLEILVNDIITNAIRKGVRILDVVNDENQLEMAIYELLKKLKEDLIELGLADDQELQNLLVVVSNRMLNN